MEIREHIAEAKVAASVMAQMSTKAKNELLLMIADELLLNESAILAANAKDIEAALVADSTRNVDRLVLTSERLRASIEEIKQVALLEDFVGKIISSDVRPNGLNLERVRVPLGVILMIYEARPNVTIDAAVLGLKSGNSVILKGGSEAINTNREMVRAIQNALKKSGAPMAAVIFVDSTDRSIVSDLLTMRGLIDVVIPRGGKGLIDLVVRESKIPVIETGASVVHVYVDDEADLEMACDIVLNSKIRRTSICNTLDVLLVHENSMAKFLPLLAEKLMTSSQMEHHPMVELRADEMCETILSARYSHVKKLDPAADFDTEYLDYVMSVHAVSSLEEAINHIGQHSLKHTECIVTENSEHAEKFLSSVDSACVNWNASTQFSDGGQFGLGAEIGISTQKLHVRGPFALEGLTTYKWKVRGNGQIRS